VLEKGTTFQINWAWKKYYKVWNILETLHSVNNVKSPECSA
jgi:hypothetical protein